MTCREACTHTTLDERGLIRCPRWHAACRSPASLANQIKGRATDLDKINRRPAMEPLAPASGISSAPLSNGSSFLNHGPSQSALMQHLATTNQKLAIG
jgi:hypothetical protein